MRVHWRSEIRAEFWLEALKGRDFSQDLDVEEWQHEVAC